MRNASVPLFVDRDLLVSFVLNRKGRDFSARDMTLLDLVGAPLARMYARLRTIATLEQWLAQVRGDPSAESGASTSRQGAVAAAVSKALLPPPAVLPALTTRERDVVLWVAAGKTDREIGSLLDISVRTVQPHLEHIYVKLGVETRTAAAMRALAAKSIPSN